mmetsp:Transcript_29262/g.63006  ORF Transcript_29262/g.63006 Transcript_29262/m.63006 type:complete len:372 (-) Transcript_29262:896-2011(-)
MISSTISTPTALVLFIFALAPALAFSFAHQPKTIMPAKEDAAAAAASDPKLPSRFIVDSFQNLRSQKLFTIHLPPKDDATTSKPSPPRAMVFLVHGLADHCCRPGYVGLYESLSEAGVDVYSLDYHGHGRSDGLRGYAETFDHYVNDVLEYIQLCQKKYKDNNDDGTCPPLVLLGQSMGGLISVNVALKLGSYHVGGIILTSPALGVDMGLELKVQNFFSPLIDKFLPKAKIVDAVRPEDMSRNPAAVQAYVDDPLCPKGKIIARTAITMSKSFDVVKERRGEISCPILMLHGTDDRCTSLKASIDFFQHVGTPVSKKRFLQLPGMYHELLEEPETDQLLVSIVEFASSGGKQFATVEGEENEGLVSMTFA